MIKKTYNINLAGRQFVIDDDAYTLANNYLDTIEHLVRDPEERTELASDIEDRMAELLTIRLEETNSTIVTLTMVEAVIARIGQPNDFIEIEETETVVSTNSEVVEEEIVINTTAPRNEQTIPPTSGQGPVVPPSQPQKTKRRLYRDPMNAVFGGVCSGIAHYLNIDPVWVRLLFVLLALGLLNLTSFSWMVFIYILLWIIIPPADTPLKRMEMFGEAPTLGNIAKTVTGAVNSTLGRPASGDDGNGKGFMAGFSRTIQTIGKGLMLFFGVIGVPVLIALVIAILALIFILIAYGTGMSFGHPEFLSQIDYDMLWTFWLGLGACVTMIVPTFLVVWYLIKTLNPRAHLSRAFEIVLAIIWFIAFIFTAVCCAFLGFDNYFI